MSDALEWFEPQPMEGFLDDKKPRKKVSEKGNGSMLPLFVKKICYQVGLVIVGSVMALGSACWFGHINPLDIVFQDTMGWVKDSGLAQIMRDRQDVCGTGLHFNPRLCQTVQIVEHQYMDDHGLNPAIYSAYGTMVASSRGVDLEPAGRRMNDLGNLNELQTSMK
jgi:hypothetical protein